MLTTKPIINKAKIIIHDGELTYEAIRFVRKQSIIKKESFARIIKLLINV